MAEVNTAIVGGNVKGDITSCKIENQLKSVKKDSVWSLQQTATYMTYDVCDRKTIDQYNVPQFTGFSWFLGIFIFLLLWVFIVAANDSF